MNDSVIFTYPSENGYQFYPQEADEKSKILSSLQPSALTGTDEISVSPFIHAAWIEHRFSGSKALFMVGLVTKGIKDEVHRGSYSTWTATKIIRRRTSFSADEGLSILSDLVNELKLSIGGEEHATPFTAAFQKSVMACVEPSHIDNVINRLSKQAGDKNRVQEVTAKAFLHRIARVLTPRNE